MSATRKLRPQVHSPSLRRHGDTSSTACERDIEPLAQAIAQLDSADPAERLAGVHAIAELAQERLGEGREACLDHLRAYLRRPHDRTPAEVAIRDTIRRHLGPSGS
ncbi:hypothetical protein [Amycolatopsis sp. NPDC059020]|uniref:hypothetical protein n=1 Tax=unclassified Amycolatopsis TaxID=2618356 RepID=UPI00366BC512